MKKFAIKHNISKSYWDEERGTWYAYPVLYTKEKAEEIQKFYTGYLGILNETIIEFDIEE